MFTLNNSWGPYLNEEFSKDYYKNLRAFLKNEYNTRPIHPDAGDIFNALCFTPYEQVKVVILGQDPYHGPKQAHGLCFSVRPGIEPPPSLQNIFEEIHRELGCPIPRTGCLIPWARQGVLLLNTVLTVAEGRANSHAGRGWERFTDRVIEVVDQKPSPVVFLLWGNNAISKKQLLKNPNHYVLTAPHPSPLSASRGFFGCGHFKRANEILQQNGLSPIDWSLSGEGEEICHADL